jgi:excalibur calcium-binding domain-containing protein
MDDPGGPWHDDETPARHTAPARRTLPDLVAEAAWSYRAAPLATRVTIDLVALAVLLVVAAAGAYLLLRDPGGPDLASAGAASSTSTTWSPTTAPPATTVPSTTTTVPPAPPTTVAPTPTTVRPTTTAPPAPPPTEPPVTAPPAPPPTPPDTSGRRPYRSCSEALMDGALPLYRGEPGYSDRLDHDGDGEACEWGDGF